MSKLILSISAVKRITKLYTLAQKCQTKNDIEQRICNEASAENYQVSNKKLGFQGVKK